MWASLKTAWVGTTAEKDTSQHQQVNTQPKDIENSLDSPVQTAEPSLAMSAIKKYTITEVCSIRLVQGGSEGQFRPAEVMHPSRAPTSMGILSR